MEKEKEDFSNNKIMQPTWFIFSLCIYISIYIYLYRARDCVPQVFISQLARDGENSINIKKEKNPEAESETE